MKAILISAGQGTRLLPLTIHVPKCLVEINGRPILDHQIEALSDAGIEEIFVVGGYRNDQIREHLQKYRAPALTRLLINPFWSVGSSIGSVWAARDQLDDPFCLSNGDTVFDATVIKDRLAVREARGELVVEPIAESQSDDMRVQVEDGRVIAVGKKLPTSETHASFTWHRALPGPARRRLSSCPAGGHRSTRGPQRLPPCRHRSTGTFSRSDCARESLGPVVRGGSARGH